MNKSAVFTYIAAMTAAMLVGCATNRPLKQLASNMVPIPEQKFMLCKYEVSQSLWNAVMKDNPSYAKGDLLPVESVSWDDCQDFIAKLNAKPKVAESGRTYRLPTAEEWEYACRIGATGKYRPSASESHIYEDASGYSVGFDGIIEEGTRPVGQKEPNLLGLYDMHDNVCEWCEKEPEGAAPEKQNGSSHRVYCGGSWQSPAWFSMASFWRWGGQGQKENFIGLRLACDVVQ